METKKEEIPVEFKNKFNSFEEFRLYKVEVAKKQLEQAFEKVKTNGNKDWKEKIKTDYDVRVVVCGEEIIGVMKRPIIEGDFRSNVSQGSEPTTHKLTELEKSESLRASKAVEGVIVGVDFIPSKNREKEVPFFIEVNSTPGLIGIEEALKTEGSVVEKILVKLQDREVWNNKEEEED